MGYPLLVRLPAFINRRELRRSLYEMMLPFKLVHFGCEPEPPELSRYLVFVDTIQNLREAWSKDTREIIRENDGTYHDLFDERYKTERIDENGQVWIHREIPKDAEKVEIPIKELFSSFEEFAADSDEYHEETGSYGYWTNPNGKWENYYLNRRYPTPEKNLSLLNGSFSNFARLCSIKFDFTKAEEEREKRFADFWRTYDELFRTKELLQNRNSVFLAFAHQLGFMRESYVEDISDDDRNDKDVLIFPSGWTPDEGWFFLFRRITYEEALRGKECFFQPYFSWARLDKDGWEDSGTTPEELISYANKHKEWLTKGNQRDWLFSISCKP
ncbi:MAG: hypothetical protein K2X77_07050 [Candidatus Obscuribacterales bacterium]|jgi:hypothetical protein|nr:hypothetical protein [Candidatus Obscuribacterales bacterium]